LLLRLLVIFPMLVLVLEAQLVLDLTQLLERLALHSRDRRDHGRMLPLENRQGLGGTRRTAAAAAQRFVVFGLLHRRVGTRHCRRRLLRRFDE
jgi:hypothetical protein